MSEKSETGKGDNRIHYMSGPIGGWTCNKCGKWVDYGEYHYCDSGYTPYTWPNTYVWPPHKTDEETAEETVRSICEEMGLKIIDTIETEGGKASRYFMILLDNESKNVVYRRNTDGELFYKDILHDLLLYGISAIMDENKNRCSSK